MQDGETENSKTADKSQVEELYDEVKNTILRRGSQFFPLFLKIYAHCKRNSVIQSGIAMKFYTAVEF